VLDGMSAGTVHAKDAHKDEESKKGTPIHVDHHGFVGARRPKVFP